jgi:sensor histidine kinase YesM
MILSYIDKSKVLLARARGGTKRAILYDHLYELKDYKTAIFEKSSNLLFRQTALIRNTVERIGKNLLLITVGVVIGTLLMAAVMIVLAIRMAEKITSPLHRLVLSAESAARGDFSPRKVDLHDDLQVDTEIQILIDAFRNMMDNTGTLIRELEDKAELERLLKKAELAALNAQINPHFLFNTLNAIKSLAMIEEADQTGQMIESLSDILRYYLQSDLKEISFQEEVHLIEQYLRIQRTRFGERIDMNLRIAEETKEYRIPPMMLQPIVENAVKHGLEPMEEGGALSVFAEIRENRLIVSVEDNGVGIPDSLLEKLRTEPFSGSEHIGLGNVMRRMEMYCGPDCFDFQSVPGHTVFTFSFPLHRHETAPESAPGSS